MVVVYMLLIKCRQLFSPVHTAGVLWLNAAETWVDIAVSQGGLVDSIVNLVGGKIPGQLCQKTNSVP